MIIDTIEAVDLQNLSRLIILITTSKCSSDLSTLCCGNFSTDMPYHQYALARSKLSISAAKESVKE